MLGMKVINTENWFKSLPVSHCFGESNVVRVVNNRLHLYLNELDYTARVMPLHLSAAFRE